MNFKKFLSSITILSLLIFTGCKSLISSNKENDKIQGIVYLSKEKTLSNFNVDLYSYDGVNNSLIQSVKSDKDGTFKLNQYKINNNVYYLVATSPSNKNLNLITVLGNKQYKKVAISPLTTVASTFVTAQFINNIKFNGNLKPVTIAMNNAPNLTNIETGSWGKTLLNGENLTESATTAKMNTLANLIVKSFEENRIYSSFTTTLSPKKSNSLVAAMGDFAKNSWYNPKKIFNLFDKSYPRTPEERNAPYRPYLEFAPRDFAMIVRFSGGGIFAPGKLVIDKDGNIWSGQNWMPGSQSNTLRGIGGGLVALHPNGTPFSPDIYGFEGSSEIGGIGWGTAMGPDKVWITSFTGTVKAYDLDGNPLKTVITGKVGNLMGVYVSPVNGDVWICDGSMGQMVKFDGGDPTKGHPVKVPGLMSPFSVVVDHENRVWVGNSASNHVTMFYADKPEEVTEYVAGGISVRGLTIDSNDNVWANTSANMDTKMPKISPILTIMEQFTQLGRLLTAAYPYGTDKVIGTIAKLDINNPNKPAMVISGKESEICAPWGVSVDGNDNLWDANFLSGNVLNIATKDMPEYGIKKGQLIHKYESGIIQLVTDVIVDYSGNVWVANNWNDEKSVVALKEDERSATKGGGSGIAVIYGAAKPIPMK